MKNNFFPKQAFFSLHNKLTYYIDYQNKK